MNGIFLAIGYGLKIASDWFTQRGNPKNVESRVLYDELKKDYEFHEALEAKDVDKIRKLLADRG